MSFLTKESGWQFAWLSILIDNIVWAYLNILQVAMTYSGRHLHIITTSESEIVM